MAKLSPCPKNRNWLTVYLTVHDAQKALDFYTKVFGFKKKEALRDAHSERIHYAIMTYKDYDIMMGPDVAFGGRTGSVPPYLTQTHSPINMYMYVEDVDAMYSNCIENNVEIITPLQQMFWGDRMFKCKDPQGYNWNFATCVAKIDLSKCPIKIYEE